MVHEVRIATKYIIDQEQMTSWKIIKETSWVMSHETQKVTDHHGYNHHLGFTERSCWRVLSVCIHGVFNERTNVPQICPYWNPVRWGSGPTLLLGPAAMTAARRCATGTRFTKKGRLGAFRRWAGAWSQNTVTFTGFHRHFGKHGPWCGMRLTFAGFGNAVTSIYQLCLQVYLFYPMPCKRDVLDKYNLNKQLDHYKTIQNILLHPLHVPRFWSH